MKLKSTRWWIWIGLLLLVLACGSEKEDATPGGAADTQSQQIDALFADVTDDESPGGAVMVIREGKIVHQAGYGLADLDSGDPITPDSLFHLGSVGKQFTALGIMLLVDEGRLDYDTPIGEYLPELAHLDEEITLRRLLQHTSGIPDYDEDEELYDALLAESDMPSNADVLAALSDVEDSDSAPGAEFSYSNTGYDVLGALIERVSGQSYAAFMEARIFKPLGMKHTFAMPNPGRTVCQSYEQGDDDEPVAVEPDPLDNVNGSGSVYSSLTDLYFYDQAWASEKLLSQEALSVAYQPARLNSGEKSLYGFGWDLGTRQGEAYVGHSGAWLGFTSYYLRFPERRLSVFVLLNFDYSDPDEEALAFQIADLYLK